ncbi:hypothetical protein HMPREF3212_01339 [Citrobacter freundii]|nr:hypothetical protein HMPREF3212_01339 [Citrobacter freundii]
MLFTFSGNFLATPLIKPFILIIPRTQKRKSVFSAFAKIER